MSAWRKRLGFITERFEAAGKSDKLKELPALSEASKSKAAEQGEEDKEAALDPAQILQAAQSVSDSVQVPVYYTASPRRTFRLFDLGLWFCY